MVLVVIFFLVCFIWCRVLRVSSWLLFWFRIVKIFWCSWFSLGVGFFYCFFRVGLGWEFLGELLYFICIIMGGGLVVINIMFLVEKMGLFFLLGVRDCSWVKICCWFCFGYRLILLKISNRGFWVWCNVWRVVNFVWVMFFVIINKIRFVWWVMVWVMVVWVFLVILFSFGVLIKLIWILLLLYYCIDWGYWVMLWSGFVFRCFFFNKVLIMVDLFWLIKLKVVILNICCFSLVKVWCMVWMFWCIVFCNFRLGG